MFDRRISGFTRILACKGDNAVNLEHARGSAIIVSDEPFTLLVHEPLVPHGSPHCGSCLRGVRRVAKGASDAGANKIPSFGTPLQHDIVE